VNASTSSPDDALMLRAVALARRGRGATAPNPCVGALLAQGGEVLARGWHTACGAPHAEVECLADARNKGVDPASCDLYVTLEPCNHHGRTPPCTEAVLAAGIRRVFVGAADPNTTVAGGGITRLREAGVEVVENVAGQACRDLIADFRVWNETDRPYVHVKLAATLDGRIATRTGHSKWITGPESRACVHALRADCGAVMVGGETFRADDPQLTARPDDDTPVKQPLAVVVTSRLPKAGDDYHLLRERPADTIFWTTAQAAASDAAEALRTLGCAVWDLEPGQGGGLNLAQGLTRLRAERTVRRVLCEGGGRLALSLLDAGRMDEFWLFIAPRILGDEAARPLFAGRAPETMDQALDLRVAQTSRHGDDVRLVLRPRES